MKIGPLNFNFDLGDLGQHDGYIEGTVTPSGFCIYIESKLTRAVIHWPIFENDKFSHFQEVDVTNMISSSCKSSAEDELEQHYCDPQLSGRAG